MAHKEKILMIVKCWLAQLGPSLEYVPIFVFLPAHTVIKFQFHWYLTYLMLHNYTVFFYDRRAL